MGGTGLRFESWKVKNHTQNSSQHHLYCFLEDLWILGYGCSRKSGTHMILWTCFGHGFNSSHCFCSVFSWKNVTLLMSTLIIPSKKFWHPSMAQALAALMELLPSITVFKVCTVLSVGLLGRQCWQPLIWCCSMRSLVTSIFLYTCEPCTLTAEQPRRIRDTAMRCYCKTVPISYKDHVTSEEVHAKIQQAIRLHKNLLTIVKRCKLQWYGHVSCWSGPAKTILQGTVKGGRRRRQTEEEVGKQY